MTKLIEITGKAISGEWGSEDNENIGIPVLRTTNFTNEGIVDYSNVITRVINKKNIDNKFLKQGDIILEKSGGSDNQPVGRVVYFEGPGNKYLYNNFTGLLRVKDSNKWDSKYIFWTLYAAYKQGKTVMYQNRTTGLHNLRTDAYIQDLEVKSLSLQKQKNISKVLDKTRHQIKIREKELAKLDTLIKARFVEMFGDPVKDELKVPKVKLANIGKWQSGGTPSRSNANFYTGNINWFSAGELNSLYLNKSKEKITKEAIEKSSTKLFDKGSMLIGMYDTAAFKMGILTEASCANQACANVKTNGEMNLVCLYYELQEMKQFFLNQRHGVRQKNLTLRMIKNFEIPLYDLKLQNKFATFVQQVDKSKVVNKLIMKYIINKGYMIIKYRYCYDKF